MKAHPCLSCGACCAFYRVSFHWSEGEDETSGGVPLAVCEDWNSNLRVMRGTMRKPSRCEQLQGVIGEAVHCGMYQLRPTPCREFTASFEDGQHYEACDRARAQYGLVPLQLEDWADVEIPSAGEAQGSLSSESV